MLSDLLRGFRNLVQPEAVWQGEERRHLVRLHCHYRCIYAHGQQRLPGLVVDLGPQGVGLRPSGPLSLGEKVLIYCPFLELEGSFLPVLGEVRWTQPGGVGVMQSADPQLEGRTWLSAVLGVLGFDAQQMMHGRRWVRAECWLMGRLGDQPVEVVNLGVGGALLQSSQTLEPSHQLSLGTHLCLPGKLQSARGEGLYGFEFDPLSGAQLQGLGRQLLALLGEAQKTRESGYSK